MSRINIQGCYSEDFVTLYNQLQQFIYYIKLDL